jgi:hypothetical protein
MNDPFAIRDYAPTRRPDVPEPAGDPPELPVTVPSDFTIPHPTTGTVDDDDAPADEHEGENEAMVRETNDATETPEEFERDDEDSEDTGV